MNNNKITSILRNTIAFKVFGLTAAILFLFSVSTYLIIYTLLPHMYKSYKQDQLAHEMGSFIAKSATLSDDETDKALSALRQRINAFITISDESNQIQFPDLQEAIVTSINVQPPILTPSVSGTMTASNGAITLTRDMIYKGKPAQLTAFFTPQPIDEASKVLVLLAPYVAVFIIIAAVGGSFFYTVLIIRPIRKITASASRMAELQLDTRIPVHSSDEIGRLASSLNAMAANLQGTIGDLETANEQLQLEMKHEREIEGRRRELFAAVSHELKSPLTIMKGQLEGMLYKIGIYKDRDVYLDKTLQVAEEMETLISDILRVSRSDELILSGHDEQVSLRELIDGLLAKYAELGLQRGVALQSSVADDRLISTDHRLLEKALSNVMHNAIMYTNYGEKVVISSTEKASSLTIQILNTGAQIDEARMDRIFEPFYRLEQSRNRNTGGSGLGLYITKHILQQLDISIQVHNTIEGVVFSFHFPLTAPKTHPGSIQAPDNQAKLINVRQNYFKGV